MGTRGSLAVGGLVSDYYEPGDYIRDHREFLETVRRGPLWLEADDGGGTGAPEVHLRLQRCVSAAPPARRRINCLR